MKKIGIDIGSTSAKVVLLDDGNVSLFERYGIHMSKVFDKVSEFMDELCAVYPRETNVKITVTGSGGLAFAKLIGLPFEQEVIACSKAVETLIPQTEVSIELGGEDAKATFYEEVVEQRMNGTCAGGTGAFIDQMAELLNTTASGLNDLAVNAETIYPIAARCGVFAKSDIQPLMNEGARKEDIAVSIFQAVVDQFIAGLAMGKTITGRKVAFLGGPLAFLPELRRRFIETLALMDDEVIVPDAPQFFVAIGAALLAEEKATFEMSDIMHRIKGADRDQLRETKPLPPLFGSREEYEKFVERHSTTKVPRRTLSESKPPYFLGGDAGSTTTKWVLIDSEGFIVYSTYKGSEGNPIEVGKGIVKELYEFLDGRKIAKSAVTGYGENLFKAAFNVDIGEVETIAHVKAASQFLPGVTFILDIGGQDMKCMRVDDGVVYSITLNEACSSGCGSFVQTLAKSVDLGLEEFAGEALFAEHPVDLGTRCTVFMNSRVKQAQKEGASIGDISAGIALSVVKNALFKVIKLRNPEEAGDKIVVQGGTFLNEAVRRAIELVLGRDVICPDISGEMGAYGAALIAKDSYKVGDESSFVTPDELEQLEMETSRAYCGKCKNNCLLTTTMFSGGRKFVSGNRCERGAGIESDVSSVPNLYEWKYQRLFSCKPIGEDEVSFNTIGIPRVLNMYENFPFWATFFKTLGFRVVLSPRTTKEIYRNGMKTLASDTVCYPAKLVHGHVEWLVNQGIKTIFYPSINYELLEDKKADNHYNCPIVSGYPEVVANNMNEIFWDNGVNFLHPFLPYDDTGRLIDRLCEIFKYEFRSAAITHDEVEEAVKAAREEDEKFKAEVQAKGTEVLKYIREHGMKAVVLAGRPYHLDPEIGHGIDKLLTAMGVAVLTEDSIAHLGHAGKLRVLDQWDYHSRLYRAAEVVGNTDDLELVQLNSFSCGLDAVTTDQVEEILKSHGKLYTLIKIDEGTNVGAIRIRLRSLLAAMREREDGGIRHVDGKYKFERIVFTREMKHEYTILMPEMSPIHFQFLEMVIRGAGYNAVLLPPVDENAVEEGQKYINNDVCFPTIVALGQIISYLKSGKCEPRRTAVFMSQTGGGCRASNYVALLRKAISQLGMKVPVVSISTLEKNPGFNVVPMLRRMVMSLVIGDVLMRVLYATRPYEAEKGAANRLEQAWSTIVRRDINSMSMRDYRRTIHDIVRDFDALPLVDVKKPKVGVVGEILVKYHPGANNDVVRIIEDEGGEAVVLDLVDFFLYGMYSKRFNYEKLSGTWAKMMLNGLGIDLIEHFRRPAREALDASVRFHAPLYIDELARKAEEILSLGHQCGEGWLLTGEMVELIDSGVPNIICMQPFACLPNQITGKGMAKALREYNSAANIALIDYDPGASTANQLNRIKLMMSTAHKNLKRSDDE